RGLGGVLVGCDLGGRLGGGGRDCFWPGCLGRARRGAGLAARSGQLARGLGASGWLHTGQLSCVTGRFRAGAEGAPATATGQDISSAQGEPGSLGAPRPLHMVPPPSACQPEPISAIWLKPIALISVQVTSAAGARRTLRVKSM